MPRSSTVPVILLAFANDREDRTRYLRNLPEETRRLLRALDQAERDGLCSVVTRTNATAADILDLFQDPRYRDRIAVFHYGGHADGYSLLLESPEGRPSPADATGLAAFLAQQTGLVLVFLNGCSTDAQVQALLGAGVAAVIATSQDILDDVATEFAGRFYSALASGLTLRGAFGEAEGAAITAFGSNTHLRHGRAAKQVSDVKEWPWKLHTRGGDQAIGNWTLHVAARSYHPLRQAELEYQSFEPHSVLIPAGAFLMGADPGPEVPEYETPQHVVVLPHFRMGIHPVTMAQYAAFIRDRKTQATPRGWFNREPPGRLDHPVTDVSWHDAMAYCAWLSEKTDRCYTLPSEAEWEKAASWTESGQKRQYPWGSEWLDGRWNVGESEPAAVTAHPTGASAYGVEDLLGNVQEWTRSLWGRQPTQPDFGYPYAQDDGREIAEPAGLPARSRLVHRGGSFRSARVDLRCSARGSSLADSKIAWRGFRVAIAIE